MWGGNDDGCLPWWDPSSQRAFPALGKAKLALFLILKFASSQWKAQALNQVANFEQIEDAQCVSSTAIRGFRDLSIYSVHIVLLARVNLSELGGEKKCPISLICKIRNNDSYLDVWAALTGSFHGCWCHWKHQNELGWSNSHPDWNKLAQLHWSQEKGCTFKW